MISFTCRQQRMRDQGGARQGPPILLLLLLPGALSGQKNGAKTEACDPGPVDMSLLYIPTSLLSSPDDGLLR